MVLEAAQGDLAMKLRKHEEACEKLLPLVEARAVALQGAGIGAVPPRRRLASKTRGCGVASPGTPSADTDTGRPGLSEQHLVTVDVAYQYTQEMIRTRRTVRGPCS